MWFGMVTLFPEMFRAVTRFGITGRAVGRDLIQLECWNPRDFTHDRHRTVDDSPYGGGPGMVMKAEPVLAAIRAAKAAGPAGTRVLMLSPQGALLDQALLGELATGNGLVLVSGRYEGIDERVAEDAIDAEVSVGDFVVSGGELPAMLLVDGVTRLLPGAVGHEGSVALDSFGAGLLDYPHFTRPEEVEGKRVPEVLLSGDHQAIARWREMQALGRTRERRPDLIQDRVLSEAQRALLAEYAETHAEQLRERTEEGSEGVLTASVGSAAGRSPGEKK